MNLLSSSIETSTGGYGSRTKERGRVSMRDDEIESFLSEWHTLNCATLNHNGSVHLVPMWYGFLDGSPAFHTKAKSQKIINLRRNSKITCMIEEGKTYQELRGIEIVGTAEIIDDHDQLISVGTSIFERLQGRQIEPDQFATLEIVLHNRVAVKVHIEKIVSWDHRKLASSG